MHYSAIIFDFDGTIADTLGEALRIYNLLARENGYRVIERDELPDLRLYDTRDLLRHLAIPRRRVPLLLARGRRLLKARIRSLPLMAGIAEVLPRLRENSECFGILTSNAVDNVEAFLEAHQLRSLFTFISSTTKLSGKSKHLRAIARTFSLPVLEMLYIGDEIRDVRAARKAGIASAAVTWGFNAEQALSAENPSFLVRSPAELLEIAAKPPA